MKALGWVLVGLMWVVCVVAMINILHDWLQGELMRRARQRVDVERVPLLEHAGTFWRVK